MKKESEEKGFLTRSNKMIIKYALLIAYFGILTYVMFFAENLGRSTGTVFSYNLIPFHEIKRYLNNVDRLGIYMVCLNLMGNIFAFMPFGFLLASLWPENDKFHPIGITILSVLASVVIEGGQYMTSAGTADIDDVILNTIGGICGYIVYLMWRFLRYGKINNDTD